MKILNQSVKILRPTDGMQALRDIEAAGRNYYRSEGKITEENCPPWLDMNVIKVYY